MPSVTDTKKWAAALAIFLGSSNFVALYTTATTRQSG